MRRLIRWSFDGAAALSAVLCIGTCIVGWSVAQGRPRSRVVTNWEDDGTRITLSIHIRGWVADGYSFGEWWHWWKGLPKDLDPIRKALAASFGPPRRPESRWVESFSWSPPPPLEGVNQESGWYRDGYRFTQVAMVLCVLPLCWIVYIAVESCVRRGARRGRCLACGYDLCATPDRCPECGTVPKYGSGKRDRFALQLAT